MNHPNISPELKAELEKMTPSQIEDAFYTDAKFGTAGIRGIIRPGTNAINIYNIRKANTAFAKYLAENTNAVRTGVAIAYDNRNKSKEFAIECAKSFALRLRSFSPLCLQRMFQL